MSHQARLAILAEETALSKVAQALVLPYFVVPYSYCKLTIIFSIPNSTCQSPILFLVSIYILYLSLALPPFYEE